MFDPSDAERLIDLIFVGGPLDGEVLPYRGKINPVYWHVPIFERDPAMPFNPELTLRPVEARKFTYRKRTFQSKLTRQTIYAYVPDDVEDGDVMRYMRSNKVGHRILSELG